MGGATMGLTIVGWANVVLGLLSFAATTSVAARSGSWEMLRVWVHP